MIFLNSTTHSKKIIKKHTSNFYQTSILYHDIFDFPLTKRELLRWNTPYKTKTKKKVVEKDGYFFVEGREDLVEKRKLRQKNSLKKLIYAKKVVKLLSQIPTIQMIGITGSLAMMNADVSSDVDFMIVTKRGTLWTTRLTALLLLKLKGIKTRRFGNKNQKDKICLNLWLDESSLRWNKRNIFTAHEIAQVLPILEKDWTYEEFIRKNRWIKKYWPNGAMFVGKKRRKSSSNFNISTLLIRLVEPVFFFLQKVYMARKITNEEVKKNRAAFHPVNLSKIVKNKLV